MNTVDQIKAVFPNISLVTYINQLENILNNTSCKTILDVGCGNISPLRLLAKYYNTVGVDGYQKAINESKKKGIHSKYVKMDIRNLTKKFKANSFDAVVALDVIEHLTKKDGEKLMSDMGKIAKKVVILVTPNGFVPQHNKINNLQEHLSGWTAEDFRTKGYTIHGIYGLKLLRKGEAEIRFKPKIFWGILSEISHYLFTKHFPAFSYSIMVSKKS